MQEEGTVFTEHFTIHGHIHESAWLIQPAVQHDRDWGLEDDVDQFVKSWKSLKGKPDAQLELINTRRSQAEEIQKHAILCRQWEKDRVASRAEELNQLKRDRFQSALDRLRQLGWGEELDRLAPLYRPLSQYDPLRAAQKLTDRSQDGENCVITLRTAVEEEWTRWMSGSYDKTLEYKGRVATEPELAAAKKNGQERLWNRHQFIWCCSLCTPRGDYLDQARNTCLSMIRDHMKETHSIHNAREKKGHFYANSEWDMQPF
ncbi:predicted protein [Postia placenta Mad-698-R]|nr:predicted protein [Postia placenta Mad-698-R]